MKFFVEERREDDEGWKWKKWIPAESRRVPPSGWNSHSDTGLLFCPRQEWSRNVFGKIYKLSYGTQFHSSAGDRREFKMAATFWLHFRGLLSHVIIMIIAAAADYLWTLAAPLASVGTRPSTRKRNAAKSRTSTPFLLSNSNQNRMPLIRWNY